MRIILYDLTRLKEACWNEHENDTIDVCHPICKHSFQNAYLLIKKFNYFIDLDFLFSNNYEYIL